MPFCSSCGKEINSDAAFCPHCGHQQQQANPSGSSFQNSTEGATVPLPPPVSGWSSGGPALLTVNDLVMKKKILSLREHYDLEDTQGNKLGEGDGNFFQMPAKFRVLDDSGSEVMHVNGKLISIRHEFDFFDAQGTELGKVKKKIVKLFGSEYWVEQNGVETVRIYGNFYEHDYRFEVNRQAVAQVHKKWVSLRDTFGISVTGAIDHRVVIGSVIAIEHEEVSERDKNK